MNQGTGNKLRWLCLAVFLLSMANCAPRQTVELPKDILGIRVGMSKEEAQKRLEEISEFERDERKQQQIWRLKNDAHYSHIAIGYDKSNQVRYLTAFADSSKKRVRFSDIGDLSSAKQEITNPHYKYTWEIPASGENPAYFVSAYGTESEFLSSCSLMKTSAGNETEKE